MVNTANIIKYNRKLIFLILGFFVLLFFARPVSIPDFNNSSFLTFSGKPEFIKLFATKNSGSGIIFKVSGKQFHCSVGIVQGGNGCFYLKNLLEENKNVTVEYFLISNRFGYEYPIVYSLKQSGFQKVTPKLSYNYLKLSIASTWVNYYMILIMYIFVSIILVTTWRYIEPTRKVA